MVANGTACLLVSMLLAADPAGASAEPAKKVEAFSLKDYQGAEHSLADWKDKKAIVVVFLGTECPLASQYGTKLSEFEGKYKADGVQFVGIDSNRQDTLQEIAHFARMHHVEFPMLKDPDARVADLFGAQRTPEAFVIDPQGAVLYHGQIDDQFGVGYARSKATREHLKDALDAILAGKPVKTAATEAIGCRTGRASHVEPKGDVTYSNQVSRILQKRCIACHRPNQIAPFSLASYEDAVAWSATIREVIDDRRMPPWHANPEFGSFANDTQMPDEEKRLLFTWMDNGMPEGDAKQLPPPREFAEGWRIRKPDLVIRMPESFTVPAKGVVEYKYFTVDPHFEKDVWIQAAEGKPGNRSVVHHLILFYLPPGQDRAQPQDALFNSIASFAPGLPALTAPEGAARRVPAGSKLIFQLHYTPNGTEQVDQSEVGLVFADPGAIKRELSVGAVLNWQFLIPPGADDYHVQGDRRIEQDTLIYAFVPHMHLRGKSFRFVADYADGKQETLLDVPKYDFNWQNVYVLNEPKLLPNGSKMHCEAHFDNSENNLSNPDPKRSVHWGDQTWEEMMVGSFYYSPSEQDLTLGPPRVKKIDENKYAATFRYKPPTTPKAVYLAGSFNEWKPDGHKMSGPDKEGWFTTTVELPKGRHEYKFVVDGKVWKTDPGNRDQTGYFQNSLLVVGPS